MAKNIDNKDNKKKTGRKANTKRRYNLIVGAFVILSAGIIYNIFKTTIYYADQWNTRAKTELSVIDTIMPERGNILSDNGNILACNVGVYDIKVDLRHELIKGMKYISPDTIAALADSLDKYYPKRQDLSKMSRSEAAKYSWHRILRKEIEEVVPEKRKRALVIARNKTMLDYKRIRRFPFFSQFKRNGFKNPLYSEPKNIRIYPYGKMAYLSIGRVYEIQRPQPKDSIDPFTGQKKKAKKLKPQIHGYAGLERFLDSLLYGKPGLAKKMALTSGFTNWPYKEAVRGYDVQTTINIDLQDMLEEELQNVCMNSGAEWGTAVLMEVKTGEIKAISNIELLEDGTYGEALNRAVLPFEPGSVMKPISLMIAFEDGLVKSVNDMVDCSPFQRTSDPHGGGMKTMKQVIEQSSNPGIARVIFRGYSQHPEKFYDRMKELGFFEKMRSGIAEEQIPRIKRLVDKDKRGNNITLTARHLDLARQAYGYNTMLPPLFTLSVYNAIANQGKYVRPRLIKRLHSEDGKDSIVAPSYIRPQVCSPATAEKVKQCLAEVVWGKHGTAQGVQDDRVKIVGKTGTAYPVENRKYNLAKRRYAFAGFFPYENPQYSCIALIMGPSGTSANRTSGLLVKNMAVKMFARGKLNNTSSYRDGTPYTSPVFASSKTANNKTVTSALGVSSYRTLKGGGESRKGTIPDVIGCDAPTAVMMLEQAGIAVRLQGHGTVVKQSLPPGHKIPENGAILLTLKI